MPEGELKEHNREMNYLDEISIADLAIESYENEMYFNDITRGVYEEFLSLTSEIPLFLSSNRKIAFYPMLGNVAAGVPFETLSNLLMSTSYSKIPIGVHLYLKPDENLPHAGIFKMYSFLDHDIGHIISLISNIIYHNMPEAVFTYNDFKPQLGNFEARLFDIFVWFSLYESRGTLGLNMRRAEIIVKKIRTYDKTFNPVDSFFKNHDMNYSYLNIELLDDVKKCLEEPHRADDIYEILSYICLAHDINEKYVVEWLKIKKKNKNDSKRECMEFYKKIIRETV
jgi:hypothetical protein